ncbi:MAG TPA: DUF4242 domain-containing protein [Methylococcaceae bacterium]|nr:DUF4242 domain-containing protein [Methylococcaceae bacterium]
MPKYIVERDIPNAGAFTPEQLQGIAQTSCGVSCNMNANVHWLESYVTDNKVYCILIADNEEALREHGEKGGFPITRIAQIKSIIDPSTAEG